MSLITYYNTLVTDSSNDIIDIIQLVIDFLNILVTAGVSIWIVNTVQKKLNNERSLKNYLISEISGIQKEYRELISRIFAGQEARPCRSKFNSLNAKVNSLMEVLNKRYDIPKNELEEYQTNLPMIIDDDPNFISNYIQGGNFNLTTDSIRKINDLEKLNSHVFYDIIIKINDED